MRKREKVLIFRGGETVICYNTRYLHKSCLQTSKFQEQLTAGVTEPHVYQGYTKHCSSKSSDLLQVTPSHQISMHAVCIPDIILVI